MIELVNETLTFSAPEVHQDARLEVTFQRTLRIPDDDKSYPLPPGLGEFPMRHVDDFSSRVPAIWREHGGVMLPMYQSEAMWICFSCNYPFAVKIAAGKINAVTGESWREGLSREPQDYMVTPGQPWLDGFCVEKGIIRQFVAMPLGAGYTAEEQITGKAEHGGLQIKALPIKAEVYERILRAQNRHIRYRRMECMVEEAGACYSMGLAPGGKMRQEIYEDTHRLTDWDEAHPSRCFVHICNSQAWQSITGTNPPTKPITARQYAEAGLPWFEYYDEHREALAGNSVLSKLKSLAQKAKDKRTNVPDNVPVQPVLTIPLGPTANKVKEWIPEAGKF